VKAAATILGLGLLLGTAAPLTAAAPPLGPRLQALHRIYQKRGAPPAWARTRGIVLAADLLDVVVETPVGTALPSTALKQAGAVLRRRYRDRWLVRLPLARLQAFAQRLSGVRRIRLPFYPRELVESEGVSIQGAADLQALGSTGQGVKVAVIDLGFKNLSTAQAAGEVPTSVVTVDYTGSGIQTTTKHGTAVAEIIHDMAPDAELYLLKIGNDVDLGAAKDYCIANGIRIINHSVGWFNTSFYDGTGPICAIADDAYTQGILWVNAAGNYANTHYEAILTDTDNDTRHEFSGTDEALSFTANAGANLEILMNWDAYPETSDDYDLFLYNVDPDLDPTAVPVASSEYYQGGGVFKAPPVEDLVYSVPSTGTYYLVVKKKSTSDADLPLAHRLQWRLPPDAPDRPP